jgi:hypothetical protein
VAEAVTMFVDRPRAAAELVRVCVPGGRVLATEFCWRRPPTAEAREVFLGQVCPGLQFDTVDEWTALYEKAGLTELKVATGPFEMTTPRGFLADERHPRPMGLRRRPHPGPAAQDGLADVPHDARRALPRLRRHRWHPTLS